MPIYAPTGFLDVTNATLRGSKIVTTSNVGVANANPLNTLSVGSNLQVEDTGSNVLTVLGNAAAAAMTLGVITLAPSYSLEIVSNIGNTVSNTVQFTNETTGFVSESNIEVGTGNLFVNTSTGLVSVGNALSVSGRADLTDLHASNLTVDGALYANASTGRVGINTTSPGDFNVDIHGSANVGALTATDVTVTGNLAVAGELTSIRSTTVNVDDPIIGLANNNTSDPAVLDIGFVMARPSTATGSNVAIIFDESSDTLEIGYTTGKHTDTTITIDDSALFHTNIHGNVAVSNLEVGQFSVVAAYGLDHVTNENNSTGDTIISTNATTGLQTTANVSVGRDALVSGNVEVSKELTVSGNTVVSQELSVSGNTVVSQELTVSGNVEVSKELTVSGNVEVSKELTVSGNTVVSQELTVSGNVEVGTANLFVDTTTGNVGVGVAHPTSRFEVAGTETLQEYPPKAMTGYETYMEGHGVFKASASSTWSTNEYEAFGAFNKTLLAGTPDLTWNSVAGGFSSGSDYAYTGTNSLGGISGEWLKLSTPYAINPSTIKITVASSYINNYAPEDFYLLGSVDDATWYVLAQETGETWSSLSHTSSINTTNTYKYFALVVTKTRGADNTNVTEMQVFGTPAPSSLEDGHMTLGKALTLPRVSGHPAGAETPRAESLVVHYDTTVDSVVSGSTVVDISGEGNNGTLVGATYDSIARCLHGDGPTAGHYTATPITLTGGAMSLSIGMWFRASTLAPSSSDYRILSLVGTKATGQAFIVSYSSTHLVQDWYGKDYRSSFTLQANTWYHTVTTYNGGNIQSGSSKIYLNGVELSGSTAYTGTLNLPTAQTSLELFDYVNATNSRHHGDIANFKLWSGVALTAEEVAMEYALGRTGKSLNLTDTALCLGGTVPRAQLDVRGNILYTGTSRPHALPTMWDHMDMGRNGPGVYPIIGTQGGSKVYNVYCEPDIFGGGWMCFTQIPQTGGGFNHDIVNLYTFDSGDSGNLKRTKFFNVPYNILSDTNGVNCDILVLAYGDSLRYNMQGAKLGAIWRGVDLNTAFDATLVNGVSVTANAAQATSPDGFTFTSLSSDLMKSGGWEFSISTANGTTGAYNDFDDGTGGFIIHEDTGQTYNLYGKLKGPASDYNYSADTSFEIVRIFVRLTQF